MEERKACIIAVIGLVVVWIAFKLAESYSQNSALPIGMVRIL